VSETKLAKYVGHYKLFNSTTNVALREGHLILEVSGHLTIGSFAASETKFFLRTEETEIEFQRDMDGIVTGITVHNNDGVFIQGPRTDVAAVR